MLGVVAVTTIVQVFEHLEADPDLEPVAVGKDHIPGRKGQIRASLSSTLDIFKNE